MMAGLRQINDHVILDQFINDRLKSIPYFKDTRFEVYRINDVLTSQIFTECVFHFKDHKTKYRFKRGMDLGSMLKEVGELIGCVEEFETLKENKQFILHKDSKNEMLRQLVRNYMKELLE